MSVQINSGISVLEMHRLTDNLSSLQCHCETTENSLTHCTHGQRERESELRQKWTWWRRNRKSKYGLLAARPWAIEAERVREVRPKTEKKNGEQQRLEEEEVWKRRMKKGERERKRESGCCQGQQHNRERSSYTTSALFYSSSTVAWFYLSLRLPASSHVCRGPCQSQQCLLESLLKGRLIHNGTFWHLLILMSF